MERGALSTDEFKEFAKEVVLFAHITSRVEGEKYDKLLNEKGGGGFPYLAAMDAEGNVIAQHGYESWPASVVSMRATMKKGGEYLEKKAKKDKTPDERIDLLSFDLTVGNMKLEDAKKAVADNQLNWRSFRDQSPGNARRISEDWEVDGWPTLVVLDQEMRIHYRGHNSDAATEIVRELLAKT